MLIEWWELGIGASFSILYLQIWMLSVFAMRLVLVTVTPHSTRSLRLEGKQKISMSSKNATITSCTSALIIVAVVYDGFSTCHRSLDSPTLFHTTRTIKLAPLRLPGA
ncbi:hypothetical protein M3J09_000105 [Ascochyta lentis]